MEFIGKYATHASNANFYIQYFSLFLCIDINKSNRLTENCRHFEAFAIHLVISLNSFLDIISNEFYNEILYDVDIAIVICLINSRFVVSRKHLILDFVY